MAFEKIKTNIGWPRREKVAVYRGAKHKDSAFIILPSNIAPNASRAEIYFDSDTGRIGAVFGVKGSVSVWKAPSGTLRRVTIPSTIKHLIPFGTTDVEHRFEGEMMVIDLPAAGPAIAEQ